MWQSTFTIYLLEKKYCPEFNECITNSNFMKWLTHRKTQLHETNIKHVYEFNQSINAHIHNTSFSS